MKPSRFTRRVQLAWIFALTASLVGIGQAFSFGLYQISMVAMIFFGLTQISVSNVAPDASPKTFFRYNATYLGILIVIVAFSAWLAPILTNLGR